MIVSFVHKGLEAFFRTGSKKGIQPAHAAKLARILVLLDSAACIEDLPVPGYATHTLKGDRAGYLSMRVNGNWRVTFRFLGTDIELVNYEDYH